MTFGFADAKRFLFSATKQTAAIESGFEFSAVFEKVAVIFEQGVMEISYDEKLFILHLTFF
jgi:hypothetical protein